ncbi:c-type cytochrome biogenesis protein CcsB [Bailinhaonella thermotolerans]|uniref:C-type cytochrome biogenesis protein CcsB n=1 Tax=Bailinhaonella thermotolerans TaxID=1070861 RepID=A0A3A4A6E1_9ACTN|nr:c-type cytochrome biogenesis protein CcsB [Bailinhaonella thermotolerans]RJL22512.1 c-type cytochrome biogenesis protein CcsB [Bailinhaonella thermotolerans]
MKVDQGLVELSDQLILGSLPVYTLAMLAFAVELAFRRTAAKAAVPAGAAVSGGAGASEGASAPGGVAVADADPESAAAAPRRAVNWGAFGVAFTVLGWAAHLGSIITRGAAADRWPWGNMYEFVVAICFAAVTAYLAFLVRHPVRHLGVFVMVPTILGLGIALRYLYVQAGPVVPALKSYWIAIHVSAAIIASGMFILAGVIGILQLMRWRYDGRTGAGKPVGFTAITRTLDLDQLERIAHRAIVFAFPIWTFAVIAGALWADRAWGRYWGWDPKETWSFITWIAYAAYLHSRATAGWKGRRSTIIQLVACACLLFNLVGVNVFISGLHSYADL